jgi:5-methylcytosine-specific restriction endonuclease McrA
MNNENNFNLGNYGSEWHIDHVIPLSKFNMEEEKDIYLAFNWRNTMPLSVKKNLSKNNKILPKQIKEHFDNLLKYHKDNKINMPQEFIDLYAKHLEAGIPLEP